MSEEHSGPERQQAGAALKRTRMAQQGLDFATLFQAKFLHVDLSGYGARMREPAGVSTEGGKQAVQHIVLEPATPGAPVITVGQANVATSTARLRTYECVDVLHSRRFRNQPFPIPQAKYQAFFDALVEFMRKRSMQIEFETRPPEMAAARDGGRGALTSWIVLLVAVVASALVGFLIYGRLG